jgi:4a-hydroxytetrahydrobiopterin dehydratase
MKCELSNKKCVPCEGGVEAMSEDQAQAMLQQVPGWELDADSKAIARHFSFKGFYKTMGFINMLAWIAQQEQHHPDVSFTYNTCTVTYTTHAINGLSENDFICASKVNGMEP